MDALLKLGFATLDPSEQEITAYKKEEVEVEESIKLLEMLQY